MPDAYVWVALLSAVAALGTWGALYYALRGNLMDQPGERRSHTVATPRGGGIAIVLVVMLAGAYWATRREPVDALWLGFLPGLLIVSGIGWWDDHRPLSPWLRLAVQAIAALLLAMGAGWQSGQWFPAAAAFVAAMVLVNVWNFMDGINGLAASQAALAALGFAGLLSGEWHWLALALFAGCVGFLPFNFPSARIFLGDVGSGALGYVLAALVTAGVVQLSAAKVPLLLLPLGVFLVDAGFTLSGRILHGEKWWTPHVSHLYQQMARRIGHPAVTASYTAFGGVSLLLSCVWAPATVLPAVSGVGAFYATAGALWVLLRRGWRG